MKNNTINKSLICVLTDTERREYGITLATTLGDMEHVEAEKKSAMDDYKNRLGGIQAKVDNLSAKVRNGKEWRDVECYVLYATPDKTHKQTIRMDTGETVSTELMTDAELQLPLPLGDDIELLALNGVTGEAVFFGDDEEDLMIVDPDEDEDKYSEPGRMMADAKAGLSAMLGCKKKKAAEIVICALVERYGDPVCFELAKLYATNCNTNMMVHALIVDRCREADPAGDY